MHVHRYQVLVVNDPTAVYVVVAVVVFELELAVAEMEIVAFFFNCNKSS